ncbi:SCO family protein [Roseateles sp.]|uniref:SCO family protein n=1 Tax=Roseateles sp. TaxID=1971397 RepID=UPI002E04147B|nr:SCO family protein [Roseateles sp.]
MKRVAAALALGLAASVPAQPLPPDAGVTPRLGAALPPGLMLRDSDGQPLRLATLLGERPLLLVPGYYRCPQLCGLQMHGLLEALHDDGVAPARLRLLRVSLAPDETPADARARREVDLAYARHLAGAAAALPAASWLTGDAAPLQALAAALGLRYSPEPAGDGYAHPAVVVVLTPDGRVADYLGGIRFEPGRLDQALTRAAAGEVGGRPGLAERVALLCARFDPTLGRHSGAVLRGIQATGLAVLIGLAALLWRQRRSP